MTTKRDGNTEGHRWREPITDLLEWLIARKKFLFDIYHFTEFEYEFTSDGRIFMRCHRPAGKYNGRALVEKRVSYTFTPIA